MRGREEEVGAKEGTMEGRDSLWDVVVVGAGPAGALTARELARLGAKTLLLDRDEFPRWKVCGATLSPGAQDILQRCGLGDMLHALGARELHTLRLGGWSVGAELPLRSSLSVSRGALDQALVEAAVEAGAVFRPRAGVRLGPLRDDGRGLEVLEAGVTREVWARAVVAADGLKSGLMARAGEPSRTPESRRRPLIGLGAVFPPDTPGFEAGVIHMAVGEAGYVGLVRVEDGSLNVGAALNPGALAEVGDPGELVASLIRASGWPLLPNQPIQGWKGTPELTRRPRRPGAERLFAVGDASGYVEPFTGEGMFWALAGARALAPLAARAGEEWNPALLEEWTQRHRRLVGRAQRYCRWVAWTLARPSLARPLLGLLRVQPRLANPLVQRIGAPLSHAV